MVSNSTTFGHQIRIPQAGQIGSLKSRNSLLQFLHHARPDWLKSICALISYAPIVAHIARNNTASRKIDPPLDALGG